MSIIFTLKMLCDLCFYFTFANFVTFAMFEGDVALITLPVFIASAWLCFILRHKVLLRFIPLILLAACFFVFPSTIANVILLIPAIVYIAVNVYRIEGFTSNFEYQGVFFLFLKIFLPFLYILLIISIPGRDQLVPFILIFLAGSVILMRILRHDAKSLSDTKLKILNSVSVIFVALMGLLFGTKIFFDALKTIVSAIYLNVIAPVLTFIFTSLANLFLPAINYFAEFVMSNADPEIISSEAGTAEEQLIEHATEGDYTIITAILVIAMICLAVYLLVKLYRKLLVHQKKPQNNGGVMETRISLDAKKTATRRRYLIDSQIREIYRKFLLFCKKQGIDKKPYMTSADYENISAKMFGDPEASSELRAIYVYARYGEKAVTHDDIKKAKRNFIRIKKNV